MKFNITTGQFSVEVKGEVSAEKHDDILAKGVISEVYRGAFPKTEVIMAKAVGKNEVTKTGKDSVAKDFKRGDVAYNADIAGSMETAIEEFLRGIGDFDVKVGKYVADGAATAKEKEFKAKLAGLELAKGVVPEEVYNGMVQKLKADYGQE